MRRNVLPVSEALAQSPEGVPVPRGFAGANQCRILVARSRDEIRSRKFANSISRLLNHCPAHHPSPTTPHPYNGGRTLANGL